MSAWLYADWPAPRGVRALTTLRHGLGVSQSPFDTFDLGLRNGDDLAAVTENRRQLGVALGLPSLPCWLRQVHGVAVARFPRSGREGKIGASASAERVEPAADAAITSNPGTVLAILTADCLPVVFAARDGSEVAIAHAGWRGLAAGVLENTLAAMSTRPQDILAWLGPAAGPQAYEVGAEVFDAFVSRDPRAATAFVPTRAGHWNVDLYVLARLRLADAGVSDVHGGGLCTISDSQRFYSHRRCTLDGSARTGRMATLAWITR